MVLNGTSRLAWPMSRCSPSSGSGSSNSPSCGAELYVARQILDHQPDPEPPRVRQQFLEMSGYSARCKSGGRAWARGGRMQIHPARADNAENLQAAAQFADRRVPHLFECAAHRQVKGGVSHHLHPVFFQRLADRMGIDAPRRRRGRLQREIDKLQTHRRHPFDLVEDVPGGMVHRSDEHLRQPAPIWRVRDRTTAGDPVGLRAAYRSRALPRVAPPAPSPTFCHSHGGNCRARPGDIQRKTDSAPARSGVSSPIRLSRYSQLICGPA